MPEDAAAILMQGGQAAAHAPGRLPRRGFTPFAMVPCSQLLSCAFGAVFELLAQHKGVYVCTSLRGPASPYSYVPFPITCQADCCGWPPCAGGGAEERKEGDAKLLVANSPRDVIDL